MTVEAGSGPRPGRDRALILLAVGLLAALCWLLVLRDHAALGRPVAALAHPHRHAAGLWLAFLMWLTMMAAMMLPAVLPWILLFARTSRHRRARPWTGTALFVGGYLAVWSGYSLGAAALQLFLQRRDWLAGGDLRSGPLLGGALLIAAGLFQWTPLKAACLKHCRSPLSFLLRRWRDGPVGAARLGLEHGAYCVACCWALMALSFALGVMNLLWMAVLTLILCVEKIAPHGAGLGRWLGAGFVVWGAWLLASA